MTAGRDINNHGHRRLQNLLNNVAGGIHQAPGSVQFNQHSLVMTVLGIGQSPLDVFLGDRMNHVIHHNLEHISGSRQGNSSENQRNQ